MSDRGTGLGSGSFELGEFRADPADNSLSGPSGKITLEPKVMQVLCLLASRAGEVVTRQEFTDTIWASEYGGDESLTRAVSLLRKALGDVRDGRAWIETVPRRGYRLVLPEEGAERSGPPVRRWRSLTAVGALASLLLVLAWLLWGGSAGRQGPGVEADAVIAVLPFDSQSSVEADRFLAEGLADEVLSALTRSRSVSVIAGNSSFQFRGEAKKDLAGLVEQLGVTHVVDGSVRRAEGELRVGVHLVDAASGLVTWSNVLTRPEAEAYGIPKIVAAELLGSLGRAESRPAPRDASPDPRAYELLLHARALMRQDPGRNLPRIIELLDQAVEREPRLAEAWALLALARLNVAMNRPGRDTMGYRNRDPEERLSASRAEAQRALALDPGSPEAMLALVVVDYRARLLPLREAERKFRAVLDHAPNHPNANMRMGMMLVELGRWDEALHYFRRAHQLDPLSLQPSGFFLQYALQTGHVEEAEAVLATGDHPWFTWSFQRLERLLNDGDLATARQWLAEARAQGHYWAHGVTFSPQPEPQDPGRINALIARLLDVAATGNPQSDAPLPADFISAAEDGLLLHFYVATLLGAVGYEQEVFDLILQRLAVDDIWMRGALFRRSFESIRAEPTVMAWFDAGTQLDYWLETGNWPDFCKEPSLPYDCAEAARAFKRGD